VRSAIAGLTRVTTRKEIVRAALESVTYQMRDLIEAMQKDKGPSSGAPSVAIVRIDGGMSASDWTIQFLADMLDAPVDRPGVLETTALGAACLAGWRAGLYPDPVEFARSWQMAHRFTPLVLAPERETRYSDWREAVARAVAPTSIG
jgi:glycerol kinase